MSNPLTTFGGMAATVSEAVEFGWGPALLERALEDDTNLVGAVQLAESMTTRLAADGPPLDGEARIDLLRVWERVEAMAAGRKQLALAGVVDATVDLGLSPEEARHEVGAALRLSPVTASDRTRVAVELRDRLPATLDLLCRGEIGWRQAANVADGVRDLPDEVARAVEQRVLMRLPRQTAAETRRSVADAVVALDPAAAAERAEKARAERRIERLGQPDSMASWWLAVPADVEQAMWASATTRARAVQAARRAAGLEEIGLDALRVDVVVDAVLASGNDSTGHLPEGQLPAAGQVPAPHVPKCSCGGAQEAAVVVDLPTLLGLADNPGHIPGYGAVPGPIARRMAADRDWIRWTVDPGTRQVIDRGRRQLPAVPADARVPRRPGPGVRIPRLQPAGSRLRVRPRRQLRPARRPDHRGQPRPALPPAPQRQDPRPLATALSAADRAQDLDQPPRKDLRQGH